MTLDEFEKELAKAKASYENIMGRDGRYYVESDYYDFQLKLIKLARAIKSRQRSQNIDTWNGLVEACREVFGDDT